MVGWRQMHALAILVGTAIAISGAAFRMRAHDVDDVMLSYVVTGLSALITALVARSAYMRYRDERHMHGQNQAIWRAVAVELEQVRGHGVHYASLFDPLHERETHIPNSAMEVLVNSGWMEHTDEERSLVTLAGKIVPLIDDLNKRIFSITVTHRLTPEKSEVQIDAWDTVAGICADDLLPLVDDLAMLIDCALADAVDRSRTT
jgi:hypothetical protein